MSGHTDDYFFGHLLTRDAAYRALLAQNRRTLHSLAADALGALLAPGSMDEWNLLPHLIEHLSIAGRHTAAHRHCCELCYLAATSGQHELFAHYAAEAETQLLLANPQLGPEQRSAALELARGEQVFRQMRYPEARQPLEHALELAEASGDTLTLCRAERRLASLDMQRGADDSAEARLGRSLALAQELQDGPGIAAAYSQLGFFEMRYRRRFAESERYFLLGLEAARLGGDLRSESTVLNNYGILLNENLGQPLAAAANWEQALAVNRAFENRVGEAINADNLGGVYLAQGRLDSAIALLRLSVQRYGEAGDTPGVGSAGGKLGLALLEAGDLPAARTELERSLAILGQLDELYWQAYTESFLGSLCLAEGDPHAAHAWFERCRQAAITEDEPALLATALRGLARCRMAEGNAAAAGQLLDDALAAANAVGDRSGAAEALLLRAEAARQAGDSELVRQNVSAASILIDELKLEDSAPLRRRAAALA